MTRLLDEYIQLHDEGSNSAWFRVESEFLYKEARYAILTHVDEYGHDLADESVLFLMEIEDDGENIASFEPVEDEALIDEIEQHLSRH